MIWASTRDNTQPFNMRFCDGVDENFHHHFVRNIGFFIAKACVTHILLWYKKSLYNNCHKVG